MAFGFWSTPLFKFIPKQLTYISIANQLNNPEAVIKQTLYIYQNVFDFIYIFVSLLRYDFQFIYDAKMA